MKSKPTLVIIPGIGDDLKVYRTFKRRWQLLGYDVHIISFGWIDKRASLKPKFEELLRKIDDLKAESLYIIGVRAGGTAAVNALAARSHIKKVVAVCAPLDTMTGLRNPLLNESIDQTRRHLLDFMPIQKQKILSVFTLGDPVVSARLSRPTGIMTLRVPGGLHPVAIFIALMFYTSRINAFLKAN